MPGRYTKYLVSLAAVAALAVPAVAQARHGSDDPINHVRREHHLVAGHRHASDDNHRERHGSDDGPNHR
jgi:hypothetical protein